jgi:osmotically inducible protein OsmC
LHHPAPGATLARAPHTGDEEGLMPTRKATATWEGTIKEGKGSFRGETGLGGAYSFSSRFESGTGSNPEELLAAAEASCFSMALSLGLERAGTPPARIDTEAACSIEKVGDGFKITKLRLSVRARVPKIAEAKFQEVAAATKEGCPVSVALRGVDIELDAKLVQ